MDEIRTAYEERDKSIENDPDAPICRLSAGRML
jgi:hypothetical protein